LKESSSRIRHVPVLAQYSWRGYKGHLLLAPWPIFFHYEIELIESFSYCSA